MFFTRCVPASVPSDTHSSGPYSGVFALKNTLSPSTVSHFGSQPSLPGTISLTIRVPAGVPSDTQSSSPAAADDAEKKIRLPAVTTSGFSSLVMLTTFCARYDEVISTPDGKSGVIPAGSTSSSANANDAQSEPANARVNNFFMA